MQFIGQKENLQIIDNWKYLPNFTIIQGDKHSGKTFFCLNLCRKFGKHYISISNRVSEIRALVSAMVPNSETVYHLKDFETASLEAKNALLKVTEEPVPGNYIIVTGGPQIKTLESRARRIIMSPYSFEDMRNLLAEHCTDVEEQKKYYTAGINTPAKIKFYMGYEQIGGLLNCAYNTFNNITYLTPEIFLPIVGSFEDRYDNIDAVKLFLEMLISIIESNIKTKSYFSYREILNILLAGKKQLEKEPTLRRKMLLFRIFYSIQQTGGIQR